METLRAPIVTILGHVDHGKTTLLDFIRKTAVASREHGGITQAIGAYQTEAEGKKITFIDTPGHAAFEKMRSRGAQVADIAVLVVAVDDGLMPQTIEAIKHIKVAQVPMIVAVNKTDLPGIDVKVQLERIKKQLSDNEVLVEEYGGDVPIVPLSAKSGTGVSDLLSTINLIAEIHELKGDPELVPQGVVIESRIDKNRGPVATILIRNGSLKKGHQLMAGDARGKVRGMIDWEGKNIEVATPSMPIEVLGFESVPPVGAKLGEDQVKKSTTVKGSSLIEKLREVGDSVLNVVIRADKLGSLEAIEGMVDLFNKEKQHIRVLSSGTGEVNESDVETAAPSRAIIVAFNVGVRPGASKVAENEHILIRSYKVIYEMQEELQDVVDGMLKPGKVEEVFGRAQIVAEFPFGKNEKIAGCKVIEGTIAKGPKVRVVRIDEIIGETKIKSLKKVRDEVQKVEKGQDCGIIFEPDAEFQIGDLVESYRTF